MRHVLVLQWINAPDPMVAVPVALLINEPQQTGKGDGHS
jgi:hypothetical protein